jgi:hypothetical protein
MSAAVLVVVGLLLCVAGALSARLAVLAAGFGVAWLLADVFGASFLTGLLVALGGAVVALVMSLLLAHVVMFFTGAVVGALVAAKLFVVLDGSDTSWLLAVVFVPAVAVVSGFLASRYQRPFLEWATAFAGAALVLSGLAEWGGEDLGLFRRPDGTGETVLVALSWVALGLLGRTVQHRLSQEGREERRARAA